jgi:hypothetical protein
VAYRSNGVGPMNASQPLCRLAAKIVPKALSQTVDTSYIGNVIIAEGHKDFGHDARPRGTSDNHSRMDVASKRKTAARRTGRLICDASRGENSVHPQSSPTDHAMAIAPRR